MSRPLNQADVATTSQFEHKKNGVWYWDTIANLVALVTSSLTTSYRPAFDTQYSSPLTGTTVAITDSSANTHLILTPAGTIAALTITLPLSSNAVDKQEVLVSCSQIVSSLTISANGASSVVGGLSAFTAGGFMRLKYDALFNAWNRVG